MKIFAQKAGIVVGFYISKGMKTSHHKLILVLELEATSFYCHHKTKHLQMQKGDQFLVADMRGGKSIFTFRLCCSGFNFFLKCVRDNYIFYLKLYSKGFLWLMPKYHGYSGSCQSN